MQWIIFVNFKTIRWKGQRIFLQDPSCKAAMGKHYTRSLKHRNAQCHIFLLVRHITKCSFWLPDLARGATMIEPYSIFAFCMIDNMPPKVSFRKSGLLAFGYVATYLCSSTCITSERTILWLALKLYIIYPDRHHRVTKVTSKSCKFSNVGKAPLSIVTHIKCNGTAAVKVIGISVFLFSALFWIASTEKLCHLIKQPSCSHLIFVLIETCCA